MKNILMHSHYSQETRLSLLAGLQNSQESKTFEESWCKFNSKYTPKMYTWAMSLGLSKADAEEVCQDLMICLLKRMKHFVYDEKRSFRGWLRTVTRNAVYDFCEKQRKMKPIESGVLHGLLDAKAIESQVDRLFDMEILEEARRQVREELESTEAGGRNWEIFTRLELTDVTVNELAAEFALKPQTVYVAKGRVLDALRAKVAWLNRAD